MKPVFANSAWVTARESLVLRGGSRKKLRIPVRYGLVIHPQAGPVLIDTGYTPHAVEDPRRGPMLRLYGAVLHPDLITARQPDALLARFGLTTQDVRFVIVTHFHADHVSGLALFPRAHFIAADEAWSHARERSAWGNLHHGIFPELFPADFGRRLIGLSSMARAGPRHGLPGGADLFGDDSMIAIDLPGHADGHFGVLFTSMDRPLLYGVDAQWLLPAVIEDRTPGYPSRLIASDFPAVNATGETLRRFLAEGGELMLCHDPEPTPYDLALGDEA